MLDSKFIQTLKSLSSKEFKNFTAYLDDSSNRISSPAQVAFRFISQFAPEFEDKAFTKEFLFRALYPKRKFVDKKIRTIISELYLALKQFLIELELEERSWASETLFLSQLRKRNLSSFQIEYKALDRKLSSQPLRDAEYYFARYEMALEANGFFGQKQIRIIDESLQAKIDSLDAWYLSLKLKETCEMLNREKALSGSFHNSMIEEISGFLSDDDHEFWNIPAIKIYYQIYQCLSNDQETQYYFQLIELLSKDHHLFPQEEARGMYKHAQNYCIRKINSGESQFLEEILRLYQAQLENGIIFFQGELAHTDFKNIVTVGLRLKEFDWVENFIYQYKEKLNPEYQENVFAFSLASFFYETRQNSKAIKLLQTVKFTDVYYETSARILLLKLYYENEEWESAIYQVQAFSIFLKRNKSISVSNRNRHLNFLRYYKKLVQLRENEAWLAKKDVKQRLNRLSSKIHEAKETVNLGWLKERVNTIS